MEEKITNEAALRISLASNTLPGVGIKSLLGVLIQHLGEPLSEQKLLSLSPKSFRILITSLNESVSRRDVTQALAILTNPSLESNDAPEILDLPPLKGPKLRVAVTSNQGEQLNGHYGSCLRVLVYEVNSDTSQLVDARAVDTSLKGEARSDFMLSQMKDCHILFTMSIGGPAAAKVTRAFIHPVKKSASTEVSVVMEELSQVISGTPPPWMQKLMID